MAEPTDKSICQLHVLDMRTSDRDPELAVLFRHELGRQLMKVGDTEGACRALGRAVTTHNKYFYADATLINDFGTACAMLNSPASWRFAYLCFTLASHIANTDVITGNLETALGVIRGLGPDVPETDAEAPFRDAMETVRNLEPAKK